MEQCCLQACRLLKGPSRLLQPGVGGTGLSLTVAPCPGATHSMGRAQPLKESGAQSSVLLVRLSIEQSTGLATLWAPSQPAHPPRSSR